MKSVINMKTVFFTLLFLSVSVMACGGGDGTDFNNMLSSAFGISEKLAADDFAGAQKAASELKAHVDGHKGCNKEKCKLDHAKMKGLVDAVAGAKDIKAMRDAYVPLSDFLIEAAQKKATMLTGTVNVFKCPMVNGKEAQWLQNTDQLANPYHGAKMLKCGGLVKKLK